MIMKYISMDYSEHDSALGEKLKQNESYVKARRDFSDYIDSLDQKIRLDIEGEVRFLEAITMDVSYDEGFKEGIRFILGCISKGEVFRYE